MNERKDIGQQARKAAERKLQRIIDREGDAGGERRKPYYLEKLIDEEKAAICWNLMSLALLELENIKIAPTPTKVPEAIATY